MPSGTESKQKTSRWKLFSKSARDEDIVEDTTDSAYGTSEPNTSFRTEGESSKSPLPSQNPWNSSPSDPTIRQETRTDPSTGKTTTVSQSPGRLKNLIFVPAS